MTNIIRKLLGLNGRHKTQADAMRENIVGVQEENTKSLRKINKTIKLILEQGEIEVTIKNVKGIMKELK